MGVALGDVVIFQTSQHTLTTLRHASVAYQFYLEWKVSVKSKRQFSPKTTKSETASV